MLAARAAINRKERLKTMNENDLQNAGQSCRCHLVIATVPMQRFEQIYPVSEALCRGTLFAALDLPFCPPEVRYEH